MVETSEHVEIMIRIVPQGNDAFGLEISGPSGEAGVQVARDEFLPPVLQQQLRQIGQRRSPVEDATQLGRTLYAHSSRRRWRPIWNGRALSPARFAAPLASTASCRKSPRCPGSAFTIPAPAVPGSGPGDGTGAPDQGRRTGSRTGGGDGAAHSGAHVAPADAPTLELDARDRRWRRRWRASSRPDRSASILYPRP